MPNTGEARASRLRLLPCQVRIRLSVGRSDCAKPVTDVLTTAPLPAIPLGLTRLWRHIGGTPP